MSINKRFIDRETILLRLKEIDLLLNSDALIMRDKWTEKFCEKYQKMIKKLNKKYFDAESGSDNK